MAQRVEAIVEPEMLVWARKKAGYGTVGEAATKAKVPAEKLAAWEQGLARPSIGQLRKLSKAYRRRLAVFFLPEPPRDFTPIQDYRVVWGERRKTQSPELLGEIEAAHERRQVALELLEHSDDLPASFRLRASLDDDPEAVAGRVRRALNVSVAEQNEWDDARVGFNAWRSATEALGVLVSQMTVVPSDEARGFSIAETRLPLIAVNNEDPYVARSFTVVHELAHVTLHESGICDLGDAPRVERFCNHVAGAVLVPADDLLSDQVVRDHPTDEPEWMDAELRRFAVTYRVSREVVLRRLLILGRTDERFYSAKRREFEEERQRRAAEETESDERTWGPSPSTIAVVRAGHLFSRVVLSSYSHGGITASDVATYLGVRLKHVPSIERAVFPARE